jgi:hypothetical protein
MDPIGIAGGMNAYSYCGEDPINYNDPLGKDYLQCLANCMDTLDPLNILDRYLSKQGSAIVKGTVNGLGMPIPKFLVKLMGIRVIAHPGSWPITSPGSVISTITKMGTRSWLRSLGAAASEAWLAYGAYMAGVEAGCAIRCGFDSCSY